MSNHELHSLITKYNVPGPRYTSYPTVPHWKNDLFSEKEWEEQLRFGFDLNKDQGISVYIHLPYCSSLCTFCGCHKHITRNVEVKVPYLQTVLKEWDLYVQLFGEPPIIKELHLGGGTPTFFDPGHLKNLIEGIFVKADKHPQLEMSFEGHPNNTSREHLKTLYELGFRRVSFGVQDYSEKVQQAIHRIQPFERVEAVHQWAREIGYTSISHDLVYGLPHQNMDDILETIRLTNQLKPDRISLYSYAHVPWVKGVGQRGYNEQDLPKDVEKRALYEAAKEALTSTERSRSDTERSRGEETPTYQEIGMDHFALKNDGLYQSFEKGTLHRNFMGYTTQHTQLMVGLGMSAISDSWTAFAQNSKTVKEYMALVEQGKIPVFRGHILNEDDLLIRRHILNLMCHFQTEWDAEFACKPYFDGIISRLHTLEQDGLLVVGPDFVLVTELGKILIRNICMCFDLYLQQSKSMERVFSQTI